MHDVTWVGAGSAPWLITPRPDDHHVVAGVTVGAGWLHQPPEHLGVAELLAAWLSAQLSRPVEAADTHLPDGGADPPRVMFRLGQVDSSLIVAGAGPAAAQAVLDRLDRVLADLPGPAGDPPAAAELDDDLRDRARGYLNPLRPWGRHLVARWPGHRPLLSALGPLGLDTLGAAELGRFAATFATAPRVYWSNEAGLIPPVRLDRDRTDRAPAPPVRATRAVPAGPRCVPQRFDAELFSLAMPDTPAARLALALLLRVLHRRLVEFQPLATGIRINLNRVGAGQWLVCGEADLLPGKLATAGQATAQTFLDCAEGRLAAEEIARVRHTVADAERTAPPGPQTMLALASRQLHHGDQPTPDRVAQRYAQATDDDVREALAEAYRGLVLAAPDAGEQPAADPPFPMAVPTGRPAATGRRFPDRIGGHSAVRCSPQRVSVVRMVPVGGRLWRTWRPATEAGVEFAEVVLRLDAGQQTTTLVDDQFGSVRLIWDLYRRGGQLRELVDRHTSGVPVVAQRAEPELADRLADVLRRRRRRVGGALGALAAVLAFLVVLAAVGEIRAWQADGPGVEATVDTGTPVTLPNGSTLAVTAGPELIEHYTATIAHIYAVQVRMCGGREGRQGISGEARNYFGTEKFQLYVGEQSPLRQRGIPERPEPRGDYVDNGECATGWLLYRLPGPRPDAPPTLRYTNIEDDRVNWRLTADPPVSPLSRPCPVPTRNPLGVTEPAWAGCPTPPR